MTTGLAGWPLRSASLDDLAELWPADSGPLVELPKDLVDRLSIKRLRGLLERVDVPVSLAGTTDLARLGGMDWELYQRYLDIQIAQLHFLGATLFRGFLQAETQEEFRRALDRLKAYAATHADVEFVLETHNGWETTLSGLTELLADTPFRLVVDFANIEHADAKEFILEGGIGGRIAYFHTRRLPESGDRSAISVTERRARAAYPEHAFLWEPKSIGTRRALEVWRSRGGRSG